MVMCKPAPPKCGSRNDRTPGHIHLGHSGFNLFVPFAGLEPFLRSWPCSLSNGGRNSQSPFPRRVDNVPQARPGTS